MTMLSKANFVEAVHGKGGGYRLNRSPDEYIVGDILEAYGGFTCTCGVFGLRCRGMREGRSVQDASYVGKSLITELQISLTASPLPI